MKFCHFLWIRKYHRHHPRNVIKLMNTGNSFSEQRYPASDSCFQQLAGRTPLRKFFLVEGQCFTLSSFLNPLLRRLAGGMINVVTFLLKKYIYKLILPFHWVIKDFFPPGFIDDHLKNTLVWQRKKRFFLHFCELWNLIETIQEMK